MFDLKQIRIPRRDAEEIPIGMIGSVPVGLIRDKDGHLLLETPYLNVLVPEGTAAAVIRTLDRLFVFLVSFHPELFRSLAE